MPSLSPLSSLVADYERFVFSAGYFSDFLPARIVESRPMNPNQKHQLNDDSIGLPSKWAQSCMGSFSLLPFFPLIFQFQFPYFFIVWKLYGNGGKSVEGNGILLLQVMKLLDQKNSQLR